MKRNWIACFLVMLLSGCTTFGPSDQARNNAIIVELEDKIDQFRTQFPNDTMEYGYGDTLEEAEQKARNGLANQILVSVRTSTRSEDRYSSGLTESRFEASSNSFSNLRLKDTKVLQRGLLEDGERVYTLVAVDQAMVEQIRTQAEKRVGVLSLVEKLERDTRLSRVERMQLAGQGLADAKRLGISDEPFVIRKQELSYQVYFTSVINEQKKQLSLSFEKTEQGNLAVTLFDSLNQKPIQAGLSLKHGNQIKQTDSHGRVVFSPIKGDQAVYLALGDGIYLDRHDKDKKFGRVYVSSEPEKASVELYQDGDLVETLQTPGYFSVDYQKKKDYQLKVNPGQDYEPFQMSFKLEKGYDVFVSKEFAEIKYGGLILTADSSLLNPDNRFEIKDGYGELIAGESLDRERMPTGRYSVTLSKPDNKDFQVVTDEVFVREGVILDRHYKEPKNREYWRSGLGWSLGIRINRELPKEHPIKVKSGIPPTDPEYSESNENIYEGGRSFFFGLKGYGQYFTLGGEIELLTGGETGYSAEDTHSGFGGSISIGSYKQLDNTGLLQLDFGYTQMEIESDELTSFQYTSDLSSPFIEASYTGKIGMIGIRHYSDLETIAITVGVGGANIKSGYKHAETVKAQAESHY